MASNNRNLSSPFWRPKVQKAGVSRTSFLQGLLERILPALPASNGSTCSPWLVAASLGLWLRLHVAFSSVSLCVSDLFSPARTSVSGFTAHPRSRIVLFWELFKLLSRDPTSKEGIRDEVLDIESIARDYEQVLKLGKTGLEAWFSHLRGESGMFISPQSFGFLLCKTWAIISASPMLCETLDTVWWGDVYKAVSSCLAHK